MMKRVIIFIIAAVVAGGYFYLLDHLLMSAQGLPIGIDLMPVVK
jgi:predicted secreted protein